MSPSLSWLSLGSVKPVSRPARVPHICAICNKQFKNNYNLRRHQSVHTGVRMKDRAREQAEGAKEAVVGQVAAVAPPVMTVGAEGRAERTTVPLSLLHLSVPPTLDPPGVLAGAQHPPLVSQDGEGVAMPNVMANLNPHAPPPAAVVMATGTTVQVGQGFVEMAVVNPKPSSMLFIRRLAPRMVTVLLFGKKEGLTDACLLSCIFIWMQYKLGGHVNLTQVFGLRNVFEAPPPHALLHVLCNTTTLKLNRTC